MIKAIFLDIDGTLVNDQKQISPQTKAALLSVQEKGVRLAIASGRPERSLWMRADELDLARHHGLIICYNGARTYDCSTGELLYDKGLSLTDAKDVLSQLRSFAVSPVVTHDGYMHTTDVFGCRLMMYGQPFDVIEYLSRSNGYPLCEHRDMADWVNFSIPKVLCAADPDYLQEHYATMSAPFAHRLCSMFTAPFFYEFTAADVTKATAIAGILPRLGITPAEVMAFGDEQNDVDMLRFAGCGIAMGNATDDVKKAADEVTLDNNNDGIVAALAAHRLIRINGM